jgi:hypothetical protein
LNTTIHPVAGFNEIIEKRLFSVPGSLVLCTVLFFAYVLDYHATGFAFNYNELSKFNVAMLIFQVYGGLLIWALANWAISTLFEGKGRLKEIWVVTVVATVPHTISLLTKVVLSNVLAPDEGMFLTFILFVGYLWSALLLLVGLMLLHDYTLWRVIWSSVLSIASIAAVVFLCVILFTLFQQITGFFTDIIDEVTYRL